MSASDRKKDTQGSKEPPSTRGDTVSSASTVFSNDSGSAASCSATSGTDSLKLTVSNFLKQFHSFLVDVQVALFLQPETTTLQLGAFGLERLGYVLLVCEERRSFRNSSQNIRGISTAMSVLTAFKGENVTTFLETVGRTATSYFETDYTIPKICRNCCRTCEITLLD